MISRVQVFETKGKQFPTLKKAIDFREGLIEEFIRKLPGFDQMRHKDRIAFIQSIIDNREVLVDLFDYNEILDEDEE
jgi:hypothetical protein